MASPFFREVCKESQIVKSKVQNIGWISWIMFQCKVSSFLSWNSFFREKMFQLYSHSATQPLRGLTEFRQSGIGAQLEGNRHQIPSSTGIREDTIMMVASGQGASSWHGTWALSRTVPTVTAAPAPLVTYLRLPGPGLSEPRLSEAGARPLSVDCEDSRGGGCPWPVLVPGPGLLLMTWSGLAMDCQYCQYCHIATHCQSDTSWHLVVAPRQSRGEVTSHLWSVPWGDKIMTSKAVTSVQWSSWHVQWCRRLKH